MSSSRKAGRCVHCLQVVEAITDDHLFPKSWYPETTPTNLEKWKIPSCGPCNKAYGKLESELRLQLVSCVDPNSEAAAGLWKKALDSLNPDKGRSPLDKRMRKLTRDRFLKQLRPAENVPMDHVLPETKPDRAKGTIALVVSAKGLHRFVEKLVRGTVFITEQRYIENKKIGMAFLRPEDEKDVLQILEQFGELHERGPGIRIRKAYSADAKDNPIFVFDIWDQFRVYAYVEDP